MIKMHSFHYGKNSINIESFFKEFFKYKKCLPILVIGSKYLKQLFSLNKNINIFYISYSTTIWNAIKWWNKMPMKSWHCHFQAIKNKLYFIKGTVQRDFRTPCFFHHSNQPGPLTKGLKYFRIWFLFAEIFEV